MIAPLKISPSLSLSSNAQGITQKQAVEIAENAALKYVQGSWDTDTEIESAKVIAHNGDVFTVQVTLLDGGHDEGIYNAQVNGQGELVGQLENVQPFTP